MKNKKIIIQGFLLVAVLVILIVWGRGGFDKDQTVSVIETETSVETQEGEEVLETASILLEEQTLENTVVEYELQGNEHIVNDKHDAYNSNPPSSGWHLAQAPGWGYYKRGLSDESALHAVEHGGVWVSYKGITEEELDLLKNFQKSNSGASVLTPREENDTRIAIVAWGKVMSLDAINIELMQEFLDINKNQTHEPFAR